MAFSRSLLALPVFALASCALDVAGLGSSAAGPDGSTAEGGSLLDGAPLPDASSDSPGGGGEAALNDTGAPDVKNDTTPPPCTDPLFCLKCAPGLMWCGGSSTCVADCKASCPSAELGCLACAAGDVPSVATCVTLATATACIGGSNRRCDCTSKRLELRRDR